MKEKRSNVRWYFAIGFFLIGVIAYMDRSNISYIAVPMMKDLGLTKTQFGLLASFFSLGYALMQVPSGMLAEKFGPRKMITVALVWWSAFTILTGMIKHMVYFTLLDSYLVLVKRQCIHQCGFNSFWFAKMKKVVHLVRC